MKSDKEQARKQEEIGDSRPQYLRVFFFARSLHVIVATSLAPSGCLNACYEPKILKTPQHLSLVDFLPPFRFVFLLFFFVHTIEI